MKMLRYISLGLILACGYSAHSQVVIGGRNVANFGIDGDLSLDTALVSSIASVPGDDWFVNPRVRKKGGLPIIDSSGATSLRNQMQASTAFRKNSSFSKSMAATGNGVYRGTRWLDAVYFKDHADNDATSINGPSGVKVIDNPSTWVLGASSMAAKTDILEVLAHLRRNGTRSNDSLFLLLGIGIYGTSGSKNVSAEFFVNPVRYDSVLKKMENLGPHGGRVCWQFTPAGEVRAMGDLLLSVDYNSGTFSLEPMIWMRRGTYDSFTSVSPSRAPLYFDLVAFNAQSPGVNGFGYARIRPKSRSGTTVAWGSINLTPNGFATPWGCASASGYGWSSQYDVNQFLELGLNFSAMGVDPALYANFDDCQAPYQSFICYTRTSNSISSSPKDFAGPFRFWSQARLLAKINNKDTIRCTKPTIQLNADSFNRVLNYQWTGPAGGITQYANDTSWIRVGKTGKYNLSVSYIRGCRSVRDSFVVLADTVKPVARVRVLDTIIDGSVAQVTVFGGDTTASNSALLSSVFGRPGTYSWSWTGPGGFSAAVQNPLVNAPGNYRLKLTANRNGCFAMDSGIVTSLGTEIRDLECENFGGHIRLRWLTNPDQTEGNFEINRLKAGGKVKLGLVNNSIEGLVRNEIEFWDENPAVGSNIYRVSKLSSSGLVDESLFCAVNLSTDLQASPGICVMGNPAKGLCWIKFQPCEICLQGRCEIADNQGRIVLNQTVDPASAMVQINLSQLPESTYVVRLWLDDECTATKLVVVK
jgi:hypothetical protein